MSGAAQMTEWAKGPPPSVGWWNASTRNDPNARRWWNGNVWSGACWVGDTDYVMQCAKLHTTKRETQRLIRWRGLAEEPRNVCR